jgi:hypothetical protein
MSQAVEQEPNQQREQQAKQQKELAVQKGIRQAEDNLVQWIEKSPERREYTKTGDKKLEESQFRTYYELPKQPRVGGN